MPWQFCQLVCADVTVSDLTLHIHNEIVIAGDSSNTSAQQPTWLSNNQLLFIYDKQGWNQLWIHEAGRQSRPVLSSLIKEDFAEPLWRLGETTYAVLDNTRVICNTVRDGVSSLSLVNLNSGTREIIKSRYLNITALKTINSNSVAFNGTTDDAGTTVIKMTIGSTATSATFTIIVPANDHQYPRAFIPKSQKVTLQDSKGRPIFAELFPPTNPEYNGLPGEKPPCVINVHSGPTYRAKAGFISERLIYTSRGWAWYYSVFLVIYRTHNWDRLEINYGGSAGFGREFMFVGYYVRTGNTYILLGID